MALGAVHQRMKLPSPQLHVGRTLYGIDAAELKPQSLRVLRLNACPGSFTKEPFKSLAQETLDHGEVYLYAKQSSNSAQRPHIALGLLA